MIILRIFISSIYKTIYPTVCIDWRWDGCGLCLGAEKTRSHAKRQSSAFQCIIPVIVRDALLGGFTLLLYAVQDCQNRIQVHATRHYQAVSLEIYPEYTQQLHDARNPVRESFAQLPVLPIWRVDG